MSQLWNSSIVSWQSRGWRREETRPAICMVTAPGQHRQPAPAWDGITKLSFNQRRQPALELTWHQCSRAANHLHFTASMHHHHPQSVVTRVTLYWRQDKIKMCIIGYCYSWLLVLSVGSVRLCPRFTHGSFLPVVVSGGLVCAHQRPGAGLTQMYHQSISI